jgi:hypothetical protein
MYMHAWLLCVSSLAGERMVFRGGYSCACVMRFNWRVTSAVVSTRVLTFPFLV